MGTSGTGTGWRGDNAVVAAVTAGDESEFTRIVESHRRELQVHCYRMLGSLEDSEDMVQETFLRAWRNRESFEGRSAFRSWLYRIATNACLDFELAYLAAIQHLPPRQRVVLILRDVLGWPASDTAAHLEVSIAAVNSALQRARATLKQHLPERRLEWAPSGDPSQAERAVLRRYIDATERADLNGLAALLREDARFTMPPEPAWWEGRDAIIASWAPTLVGPNALTDLEHVITRANRQPAVAACVRLPGTDEHVPLGLDVLRIDGSQLAEVTAFGPRLFPRVRSAVEAVTARGE